MKKSITNRSGKKTARRIDKKETADLRGYLAKNGQYLLPMVDLITSSKQAVDELVDLAGRAMIEALLLVSAEQVAGPKRQGRRDQMRNQIGWHGVQQGRVVLSERKLEVSKPRLRTRGPAGKEVGIPAYEAMQNDARLGERMLEILMKGVSTRKYEQILPEMASTAGVARSSVSREFVEQSAEQLKSLLERRFDEVDLLVIYIDGLEVADHHVVAAIGVDSGGYKQVLGLAEGASENQVVVTGLLEDLVRRGVRADRRYLFVIDGSKALHSAIKLIFPDSPIQRCRVHKMRNVAEYLPEELRDQVQAIMRAAYKLHEKEGMAKLKKQAEWLEKNYPQAAASLLEGLEETFTINRLGLTPRLMRHLATTNIIENPNGTARRISRRVCRWRDGEMVMRWAASAFLEAEKSFRRISGWQELWVLNTVLNREASDKALDARRVSA